MEKMLERSVRVSVEMIAVGVEASDLPKILRGVAVKVAAALIIFQHISTMRSGRQDSTRWCQWQLACNCLLLESSSSFSQWVRSDWLQSLNLSKGLIPPGICNR